MIRRVFDKFFALCFFILSLTLSLSVYADSGNNGNLYKPSNPDVNYLQGVVLQVGSTVGVHSHGSAPMIALSWQTPVVNGDFITSGASLVADKLTPYYKNTIKTNIDRNGFEGFINANFGGGKTKFFVGGGLGVYYLKYSATLKADNTTYKLRSSSGGVSNFVHTGFNFFVGDDVMLQVGYKYLIEHENNFLLPDTYDKQNAKNGVTHKYQRVAMDLSSQTIYLGVGFKY